jgi:hypothetical protein
MPNSQRLKNNKKKAEEKKERGNKLLFKFNRNWTVFTHN